jgi:phosphoserine aminotransferase
MQRVHNFSAGPAAIPLPVLEQARADMLDWQGTGMSVMEVSHRGDAFVALAESTERDLRTLMGIPPNYRVLFLQGGGVGEFSAVPMNLLRGKARADYVETGVWSTKGIAEAKRFCDVNVVATSADKNFTYVPALETWRVRGDTAYLHICTNETIHGVEMPFVANPPDFGVPHVPLVSDMSSHILSRVVDVSRYGLIYAGAQKNIGPSGLTLVIVREDLLGAPHPHTPSVFDYTLQAKHGWMYNTPNTFGVYLAGLTFKWLLAQGGVAAMEAINIAKAKRLYGAIDHSNGFYVSPVAVPDRSRMNVPFTLKDAALEAQFLAGADAAGLSGLQGHRSVGGMRASIYNATGVDAVEALVAFMADFAKHH